MDWTDSLMTVNFAFSKKLECCQLTCHFMACWSPSLAQASVVIRTSPSSWVIVGLAPVLVAKHAMAYGCPRIKVWESW